MAADAGRVLELPQLRELQEHVTRSARDDEPGDAVAEAAAQQVVAQEGERRVAHDLQSAGAAPASCIWLGGERRVAIDRLEVIGDVAIGVVLQLAAQASDGAVDGAPTRARTAGPLGGASIVEPQLLVGVPVGGANPASEMDGDARNAEAGGRGSAASGARISSASAGGTRSSASSDRIQSWLASDAA